jgi:hypothetical protein
VLPSGCWCPFSLSRIHVVKCSYCFSGDTGSAQCSHSSNNRDPTLQPLCVETSKWAYSYRPFSVSVWDLFVRHRAEFYATWIFSPTPIYGSVVLQSVDRSSCIRITRGGKY